MVRVKRSDGLPPNFDDLPEKMKRVLEEQQYRRQMKWGHAYCPGDPRLTSMSKSGLPVSGLFGDRVDDGADTTE